MKSKATRTKLAVATGIAVLAAGLATPLAGLIIPQKKVTQLAGIIIPGGKAETLLAGGMIPQR